MSETTSDTEKTEAASRTHLKPVPESAPEPTRAPATPARSSGGHMTGLLALLLAVAVFAGLAQFSSNRQLQAENQQLRETLASTQAELDASRSQMDEARDALGGLHDTLARIESLLTPPAAPAAEATAPPAAAPPAATPPAPAVQ